MLGNDEEGGGEAGAAAVEQWATCGSFECVSTSVHPLWFPHTQIHLTACLHYFLLQLIICGQTDLNSCYFLVMRSKRDGANYIIYFAIDDFVPSTVWLFASSTAKSPSLSKTELFFMVVHHQQSEHLLCRQFSHQ